MSFSLLDEQICVPAYQSAVVGYIKNIDKLYKPNYIIKPGLPYALMNQFFLCLQLLAVELKRQVSFSYLSALFS